jgi:hypothetical protein
MPISDVDKKLLERLFSRKHGAWEDFVDRYMGLVVHVVQSTSHARSIRLTLDQSEQILANVFTALSKEDYKLLRAHRGTASLSTYLTVLVRRLVCPELISRRSPARGAFETVSPHAITIAWDAVAISPEEYADLVSALGDYVRANGGIGVELLHSHGFGITSPTGIRT